MVDFEKGSLILKIYCYLYEKGTEKSCISVPLNFHLKKMSSHPNWDAAQEFIFVKNIAKPSSAGRNESLRQEWIPCKGKWIRYIYNYMCKAIRVKFLCFLIYPDTWKKKWLNVAKWENE